MSSEISRDRAEAVLKLIVGLRCFRCSSFGGTRHFEFTSKSIEEKSDFTLGIECPWRIVLNDRIVVGVEDYFVNADDNESICQDDVTQGWNLQDELLLRLFGEKQGEDLVNSAAPLVVDFSELGKCADLRIGLRGGYVLEVFPASAQAMEWILRRPTGNSIVVMNGRYYITKDKRKI